MNRNSTRPRILQMITRADLGGGQVHVLDLLRGFRDEFEMVLATGEEGYCTEQAEKLGIEYHILPGLVQKIQPASDVKAVWSAMNAIRAIRPDMVHCHTTKAGLVGRLAAWLLRVPTVFTAHTWCFSEGTSPVWQLVGRPAETLAGYWASRIITVSESNRLAAIEKGITTPEKLVTVHNGVPDTLHRARPGAYETPRIIMVARFVPQKNQQLLVEAVSRLGVPAILTFVGDGPLRPQVEAAAKACPSHVKVEFLGQRQDIPELLAQSHIFALSTNWEGFPISILEGMRAGLPVVAAGVNGVGEAVHDSENGILVRPHDGEGLYQAVDLLVTNAALRERMGTRSRLEYEQRFSVDAMLRKTTAVYDAVLKRTTSKSGSSQVSARGVSG
jgi:glycosyltransferase involved in cell wall biosynthesis